LPNQKQAVTDDICRRVAEAARAARLRHNLSRATLAKRAGVSQASLIRF
jgi:transcriptional regulator with XRE-family HTH domain